MWSLYSIFVTLLGLALCQFGDNDLARALNASDSNFWDKFEIVTQPPLQDLAALENCGEGTQAGKFVCVPYYNCDPKSNVVMQQAGDEDWYNLIDIRYGDSKCQHYLDKCCQVPQGGLASNISQPSTTPRPITSPPLITSRPISTRRPTTEGPVDDRLGSNNITNNINNNNNSNNIGNNNGSGNNNSNNNDSSNNNSNNNRNNVTMKNPGSDAGSMYCGIRNENGIDFQVTGDSNNEAEFGEFPWMTALLEKTSDPDQQKFFCGGSLIAPNVVLTGSHCVTGRAASQIKIRAGEWDSQTQKERIPHQERDVEQIILHEEYGEKSLFNDVALLILTRPLSKTESIGTVCLPTQAQRFNSQKCFATGWGKDRFGKRGQYSVILKKIQMPLVQNNDCERALKNTRLGNKFMLHKSFVCAGGEEGVDACTGDGGSPLVCPDPVNPNRYVQVGIVSWGIGCGETGVPGVYGDVTQFRSWIDQKLQQLSISPVTYSI